MLDEFLNKVFESGGNAEIAKEKRKSPTSKEEEILSSREVAKKGESLGGGIGSARFIQLKDDGGAVFKPHSQYEREKAMVYIGNERAAYLVDRFLGFNFVPPTVIRNIDDETGSLQEFMDAKTAFEVKGETIPPEELLKLYIFDELIRNNDRREDNWLIKGGKIYAIDHGLSFYLDEVRYSEVWSVKDKPIPANLRQSFKRFIEWPEGIELLRELLAELLGPEIADAYIKRIRAFIKAIDDKGFITEERFDSFLKLEFKKN